jgi:hypothetical protein
MSELINEENAILQSDYKNLIGIVLEKVLAGEEVKDIFNPDKKMFAGKRYPLANSSQWESM